MLSDRDILKLMEEHEIKINPYMSDCIRPSSYLLRLSPKMLVEKERDGIVIDTKNDDTAILYDEFVITENGHQINPGTNYICCSLETISISNKFSACLSLISSLARAGISLNRGSHLVSPTFGTARPSTITFELHNQGKNPIVLYPNIKICHIYFFSLSSPAITSYNGIYCDSDSPIPANFRIKPSR
jgi:dCTP deaminase